MNLASSQRALSAALAIVCAIGAAPLQALERAADQAEAAQNRPELAYDKSFSRGGAPAVAAAGAPGLRIGLGLSKPASQPAAAPVPWTGEDRAVTAAPKKPGFFESKMAYMGSCGLLGALLGFLALGPWGAAGGAILGGAFGWFGHGKPAKS